MPKKDLCVRLSVVDYDGTTALEQFKSDPTGALNDPGLFLEKIAPRLVSACEQLGKFTGSL